jgi:hypothetical protein
MSSSAIDWANFLVQVWPTLLVCIAGFIFGMVMMSRHRTPAVLALVAMAVLAAATFVPLFTNRMIDFSRATPDRIRQTYAVMGMVANLLRAMSIALLLWAAFAGRARDHESGHGFGVMSPPQYPQGMQYPAPHNPAGYGGVGGRPPSAG